MMVDPTAPHSCRIRAADSVLAHAEKAIELEDRVSRHGIGTGRGNDKAAMTRLQGRLRRLEASIVDDQGLIPYTPRWLEYWMTQMQRLFAGEDLGDVRIPLQAARAIIAPRPEPQRADEESAGRIPLEAFDAIIAASRSHRESD